MKIFELEKKLFKIFPKSDAEVWDNTGLICGDKNQDVKKIAFNLDLTADAILEAHKKKCNVLITHHPLFVSDICKLSLGPSDQAEIPAVGRAFYEASRTGVNCIAMHTNADRSILVRRKYASTIGVRCTGNFEHLINPSKVSDGKGYGSIFTCPMRSTLKSMALHFKECLGGELKIWGNLDKEIKKIAFLNGSFKDMKAYDACIKNNIDCFVVGETSYNFCLDFSSHVGVIELGHDISELPIVDVLMKTCIDFCISSDDMIDLKLAQRNWTSI